MNCRKALKGANLKCRKAWKGANLESAEKHTREPTCPAYRIIDQHSVSGRPQNWADRWIGNWF